MLPYVSIYLYRYTSSILSVPFEDYYREGYLLVDEKTSDIKPSQRE